MTKPRKNGKVLDTKFKDESMKKLEDFCERTGLSKTAAVASCGLLAPVTGVHKKRKGAHVWFCQDCGCELTK